jgi:hypothetical protein
VGTTAAGTTAASFTFFLLFIETGGGAKGFLEVFCHVGSVDSGKEVGGQLPAGLWRCTCNQWCSLHCVVFHDNDNDILQHSYLKEYIKEGLYMNN